MDLTNVVQEIENLGNTLEILQERLEKHKLIDIEKGIYNYHNIIKIRLEQVNKIVLRVFPHIKIKRGLVNGLGSIIKCITGNLDQQDAKKYDKILSSLSEDIEKQNYVVGNQISLVENALKHFNKSIQAITHNQELVEKKVNEIINTTSTLEEMELEIGSLISFNTIYNQMFMSVTTIFDIMTSVEDALTFAKLNTMHTSIIEPDHLKEELIKIKSSISHVKLPFEPSYENLVYFENIIEIKAYTKENQIVFILIIPLVERIVYDYFHLYSFPVPVQNNLFKIILPTRKFLLLHESSYSMEDTSCIDAGFKQFICRTTMERMSSRAPCEVNLIQHTRNYNNCHAEVIEMSTKKIQKIAENEWITI